jgi:hypothetical protein
MQPSPESFAPTYKVGRPPARASASHPFVRSKRSSFAPTCSSGSRTCPASFRWMRWKIVLTTGSRAKTRAVSNIAGEDEAKSGIESHDRGKVQPEHARPVWRHQCQGREIVIDPQHDAEFEFVVEQLAIARSEHRHPVNDAEVVAFRINRLLVPDFGMSTARSPGSRRSPPLKVGCIAGALRMCCSKTRQSRIWHGASSRSCAAARGGLAEQRHVSRH